MMREILLPCFLLLVLLAPLEAGVTVQLADGTTYEDASIRSVDEDSVLLTHSGGIARIPLGRLDPGIREKLGLKPTAETAKFDFNSRIKKIGEVITAQQSAYRERLLKLESELRADGDIDAVVEIRSEISTLPDLNPDSETENEKLRQLRREYVEQREAETTRIAETLREALENYRKQLEKIADDLTRSGNEVKASEVRLEINQAASMASNPTSALAEFGFVPTGEAAREMVERDSRPPFGRIVILPVTESAKGESVPKSFEAVKASDRSDVVRIGHTHFPTVAAILADGNLASWTEGSSGLQIIPGANEKCLHSNGFPVVGLDRDGTLNFTEGSDPRIVSELKAQSGVVELAATFGLLALVSQDGSVSVIGPRSDHAHSVLLEKQENVRAVGFSGLGFITILKRDGTIVKIRKGETSEMSGIPKISKLRSDGIGETEDGTLRNLGGAPESFLQAVGSNPRRIYEQNHFFCAISADGTFHCRLKDESGNLISQRSFEEALRGALDFAPIHGPNDAVWIAVLLPSSEIDRSGLWDADELNSARR